jgi:hypothetical protein
MEAITGRRPELELVPADTLVGTEMILTVNTGLPTTGFRLYGEGSESGKPEFESRVFQAMPLDTHIPVDAAMAARATNQGRFLANWSMPYLESILDVVCSQFWYGVVADAKGFPGIISQAKTATTHLIDVAGTTAGQRSSCWFLELGRGTIEWLWGNGRPPYMDPAWRETTLYDANGQAYPGLENWVHGCAGMRLANKNRAVRIKGLTSDTNYKLTDERMHAALKLCTDLGMLPTHIFMSSTQRENLRASRTATNVTGAPAPVPRDFEGIPIIASRFIRTGETI